MNILAKGQSATRQISVSPLTGAYLLKLKLVHRPQAGGLAGLEGARSAVELCQRLCQRGRSLYEVQKLLGYDDSRTTIS